VVGTYKIICLICAQVLLRGAFLWSFWGIIPFNKMIMLDATRCIFLGVIWPLSWVWNPLVFWYLIALLSLCIQNCSFSSWLCTDNNNMMRDDNQREQQGCNWLNFTCLVIVNDWLIIAVIAMIIVIIMSLYSREDFVSKLICHLGFSPQYIWYLSNLYILNNTIL